MIADRSLKITVAGLGRIAWQYHIPAILAHPGFRLVAVADPLPDRQAEARESFGIPAAYATTAEMLDREMPDLLLIASPTCFHKEQILEAFRCGIDVICEKPLACSLTEAEEISRAMRARGRKLTVYQPHRLCREALVLREIIASGALGKVFTVRRCYNMFSRRNDWQAFSAYGGGMLNNYGSHFIDQFIFLFGGGFRETSAVTRRVVSGGDAEDFVKMLLVNRDDVSFDLEINMAAAYAGQEWRVYGDCGTAVMRPGKEWALRCTDPAGLRNLEVQDGMAARGRLYPHESDIAWIEKSFPLESAGCDGFYESCYRYFGHNGVPPVPVAESLEVMTVIERCRNRAATDFVIA